MKKRVTALVFLIACVLLVTGCGTAKAAPQQLAAETQKIVSQVKEEDNSVFEQIQKNVERVERLKTEIETSEVSNKQKFLNNVVNDLEKVTASYEELARGKDSIRKYLLKKVTAIEKLQATVQQEMARLTELKTTYTNNLRTFNDPNPEIVRTRQAALEQAINYIDMQLQLWNEFHKTEQSIKSEMVVVQQRIDSFLSVIESSAILFREGLNLLKLQRDINDALSLFTQDLPTMEKLTQDMEQSWSHLDVLVHTLTSMSIEFK